MSTVNVRFLHNCADDRAGEVKPIDATRAKRLQWTGYVEILDGTTETAVVKPSENAARPRAQGREPKREHRG